MNALRTLTFSGAVSSPAARALTLNGVAGNTGAVVLGVANSFTATSSLTLRAGTLRADNAAALTGLTGSGGTSGITLDPLSTATLGLNAAGTYPNSLRLVGTSASVQSVVNGLAAGTTTLSGPVTVAGSGTVALNVAGGGTLDLTSTVGGAFTGTLQVGGASGSGRLGGAVSLSAGAGLVKTDAGSTWTLGAANTWATTAVRAGVLRATMPGALPSAATLTLGTTGSATVGTLDLFGISQSVGGLDTLSSDALVNPAGNRIGIGDGAGAAPSATLTFGSGTSSFAGTLVDNVGSTAGKTVFLTVSGGSLTLQSANTYSGATLVSNGTLLLGSRAVPFGSVTNFGSFANSPTVTVRSGAGLPVTGADQARPRHPGAGGQFANWLTRTQTLRDRGSRHWCGDGSGLPPPSDGGEPVVGSNGRHRGVHGPVGHPGRGRGRVRVGRAVGDRPWPPAAPSELWSAGWP